MYAGRDAPPVVDHRDAVVYMNRHVDHLAEPGHMFVHAIVDDFVDEMVQSVRARTPDIHGWSFAYGVESFQNFDLVGAVAVRLRLVRIFVLLILGHSSPS